jgi:DNA polymerase-3 subunit beta
VLWEIEGQRTGMIATDGHRLGSSFHNAEMNVPDHICGIIAPKSIIHLTKIVGADAEEATVSVTMGEKYVLFSTDTITLCSKLIDGPYPDYGKVIPRNNPKKAVVDKRVLIDAVRRVSVLSNQKTHLTKFLFTPNQLEVTVLNRDIGGEARQVLEVEYEGEEHALGFNGHYLSEILNIVDADRVRIEMNTQISACLVFPESEEQTTEDLFLIMPLRIMDEA